jgi:serine protease inhibitor
VAVRGYVDASNALCARWCAEAAGESPDRSFVLSAAGVWPLLALLADVAGGPARDELVAAIGRDPEVARHDALTVIETLRTGEATSAALGVWASKDLELDPRWVASLPDGVVGALTDQDALDDWCRRQTHGQITEFPLAIRPQTLALLASAVTVKTAWEQEFYGSEVEPMAGPWVGRQFLSVSRQTPDLDDVAVLDGGVTRVRVAGVDDVDVRLVIGHDGMSPAAVLAHGLDNDAAGKPGSALAVGHRAPGLEVFDSDFEEADCVELTVPAFEISSRHDLLTTPELFGLQSATDDTHGHFPGMSAQPLAIGAAAQDVRAAFSDKGFEAAAVTALRMGPGAAWPTYPRPARVISVRLDRPFGFVAVHRPTGLALVAGWVTQPPDPPPDPFADET